MVDFKTPANHIHAELEAKYQTEKAFGFIGD
jgi:hypothetical protein